MPQYSLARHVFLCLQGEHVVFLDVRKDRYFALEAARTAGLGELIRGWPVSAVDRGALNAVVALLLEKEILTAATADGKPATPVDSAPLQSDLSAEAFDESTKIGFGAFSRFVSAAVRAALILKYRSFESAVTRVKARVEAARARAPVPNIAHVHHLVGVFSALRPFFFTSKDACLFDALALSEFLAGYRIYPHWVFAVQARPFAAHCWLQLDGTVLNDTLEHVKRYTPIMVA